MQVQAGFAEVDITPIAFPVRTYWGTVETVVDPLFAQASVFDDGAHIVAFLALDIVIIERQYVEAIRERVSRVCPIAPSAIMVTATHNHACPAVVDRPWSAKEPAYLELLVERSAEAVVEAYEGRVPVQVGTGSGFEGRVSFNRRYILKNGSVISQPSFAVMDSEVLYGEGTIDPEVGVLAVRDGEGQILGLLVNFACHATHLMGQLSAGFPGVLRDELKATYGDCVCLFLNGACGNVIHRNFADPDQQDTKEHIGAILAADVRRVVDGLSYQTEATVAAHVTSLDLAYREIAGLEENLDNLEAYNVFQSLLARDWYRWSLTKLKALHAERDHEVAEVQVLRVGATCFGAVPAEYFAQFTLRIKEESPVPHTFVVTLANGWLGYIPHRQAFERIGGHESTWCISSKMAPEAGDQIADAMLGLICQPTESTAPDG